MQKQNPVLVQYGNPSKRGLVPPLILIHDGGGTVFGYFCLGILGREVWAISDPHYATAEPWKGGPEEMARHYIDLIQKAGITGDVLLGGWSLGGYISIVMANMLARDLDPPIRVSGLVLVDCPYHIPSSQLAKNPRKLDTGDVPELVQKSFDNCDDMLDDWKLPKWGSRATYTDPFLLCSTKDESFLLGDTEALHYPLYGPMAVVKTEAYREDGLDWSRSSSQSLPSGSQSPTSSSSPESCIDDKDISELGITPPPAVLIRCSQYLPTIGPVDAEPLPLDIFRDEVLLGWDRNYPPFIKAVFDIESHHFDVFKLHKVDEATQKIRDGLQLLDTLRSATEPEAIYFLGNSRQL